MLCHLSHLWFIVRCASPPIEISSLLISWCTMIQNPRLHLSPTPHLWLTIILFSPSPIYLLDFKNIPLYLLLTMVHHLLLLSLARPVFSWSKHHRPPTNGLVFLHSNQYLRNLLFLTEPILLILLLKDNYIMLVSLLILLHLEPFPHVLTISKQFLQAIILLVRYHSYFHHQDFILHLSWSCWVFLTLPWGSQYHTLILPQSLPPINSNLTLLWPLSNLLFLPLPLLQFHSNLSENLVLLRKHMVTGRKPKKRELKTRNPHQLNLLLIF